MQGAKGSRGWNEGCGGDDDGIRSGGTEAVRGGRTELVGWMLKTTDEGMGVHRRS